jgi:hypothetical protein
MRYDGYQRGKYRLALDQVIVMAANRPGQWVALASLRDRSQEVRDRLVELQFDLMFEVEPGPDIGENLKTTRVRKIVNARND